MIILEAGGRFELPVNGKAGARSYGVPGFMLAANQKCFDKALEIINAHK